MVMFFPQYPGAADKLREIHSNYGYTYELSIREISFPWWEFNLSGSKNHTCLMWEGWDHREPMREHWFKHPEIVTISHQDNMTYGATYNVFHPKWDYLKIIKERLRKKGMGMSPTLVPELFGIYLTQGEKAFSLIGDFNFLEIERHQSDPDSFDWIKKVLLSVIQNIRDLDLKDITVPLLLLYQIHDCGVLLQAWRKTDPPIPASVWEDIKQILDFMPQIGHALLAYRVQTLSSLDSWVYPRNALKICQETLEFLLIEHRKFLEEDS